MEMDLGILEEKKEKKKERKVYQDWKERLEFIRNNSPENILKFIYELLDEKKAFNYLWISLANKRAMEEVIKNE